MAVGKCEGVPVALWDGLFLMASISALAWARRRSSSAAGKKLSARRVGHLFGSIRHLLSQGYLGLLVMSSEGATVRGTLYMPLLSISVTIWPFLPHLPHIGDGVAPLFFGFDCN